MQLAAAAGNRRVDVYGAFDQGMRREGTRGDWERDSNGYLSTLNSIEDFVDRLFLGISIWPYVEVEGPKC